MNKYSKFFGWFLLGICSAGVLQAMNKLPVDPMQMKIYFKNNSGSNILVTNTMKTEKAPLSRVVVPGQFLYVGSLKDLDRLQYKTYKLLVG